MEPLDFCLITTIPKNNYFSLTYHSESAWYFLDCMVIILPRGKTNALFDFGYKIFVSSKFWVNNTNQQSQPECCLHSQRNPNPIHFFWRNAWNFSFFGLCLSMFRKQSTIFCGAVYLLFFRYSPSVLPPPPQYLLM